QTHLTLRDSHQTPLADVVAGMAERTIPDTCAQCMPSSRTGNAVYHKLLADLRAGVPLSHQPFARQDQEAPSVPSPAERPVPRIGTTGARTTVVTCDPAPAEIPIAPPT